MSDKVRDTIICLAFVIGIITIKNKKNMTKVLQFFRKRFTMLLS